MPKLPKKPKKPKKPAPESEETETTSTDAASSESTSSNAESSQSKPARIALSKPAIPVGEIKDSWRPKVAPGARTIAPAAPTFCQGEFTPWKDSQYKAYTLERLNTGLWKSHEIARAACTYPKNAQVQEWVAAFRQHYENELRLPDSVVDDVLRYTLTHDGEAMSAEFAKTPCAPFAVTGPLAPDEAPSLERLRSFACRASTPKPTFYESGDSIRWWMDRTPEVTSAIETAAWVHENLYKSFNDQHVGARLWIRGELDRFDLEAAVQEVSQASFTDLERLWATTQIYRAAQKKRHSDAMFEAEVVQRPELAEMMVAGPKASKKWHQDYAKVEEPYRAAISFEQAWMARDTEAVNACADTLGQHMKAFLQANDATSLRAITTAASTGPGYTYISALYRCHLETKTGLAPVYGEFIKSSAFLRGPRAAAVRAGMAVNQEWKSKQGFVTSLSPRGLRKTLGEPRAMGANALNTHHEGYGAWINSVTPSGDSVKVTFQRKTYQSPIYTCVTTNRIDRILSDGKVVYKRNCTQSGTETVDITRQPTTFRAADAAGLKAGRFVWFYTGEEHSFPIAVFEDDSQTTVLSLMGIPR